jgi:hypothetical protein
MTQIAQILLTRTLEPLNPRTRSHEPPMHADVRADGVQTGRYPQITQTMLSRPERSEAEPKGLSGHPQITQITQIP